MDRVGAIEGVQVETVTMLLPGTRAGVIAMTLKNLTPEPREVPIAITAGGALDRVDWWEFDAPRSRTATSRTVAGQTMLLEQAELAVVLRATGAIEWADAEPRGRATVGLPASGTAVLHVAFAIGPVAEAQAECERITADPAAAMAAARADYARQVDGLFQRLPRLESDNAELEQLYNRSLVHLITNRWDVPEFFLKPYYGTGSINGGCVCSYLWNYGENWEIMPLADPEANREHIRRFVAIDMTKHFAFDPIGGKAFGPWYMVNQEKIIGLIYFHVRTTGDMAFLDEVVEGRTILEHVIANAMLGDDPSKPVAMIDYGPSGSHLELRRELTYNHVMPDLNGRRYENYRMASELAAAAGKPMPLLMQRAKQLKAVLRRELWDPEARWFHFINGQGEKEHRYTVQMFKLFGSEVLDAEQEAGLLAHLNDETEFLSDFGLHSLAKTDPAYDPNDVDNGGPGACTCFPPQIAERLYKAGRPADAENILNRILWWGQRMPYWGDSIVAERIDYRRDTPLQCTVDGATMAQCIIFGMFGVHAEFDGGVRIHPQPPQSANMIALRGLCIRGHELDIVVDGDHYDVLTSGRRLRAPVGRPIVLQAAENP